MSQVQKLYIGGVGSVTPLGGSSEQNLAAIRAGISAIKEIDLLDDKFNPVRMACIPDQLLENVIDATKLIMPMTARQYRMLQISVQALNEIIQIGLGDLSIPLFLAAPEQINDGIETIPKAFLENLKIQTGLNIDIGNSRVVATGRAGGLSVIDIAFKYLEAKNSDIVLVGGVDSFYDQEVLNYFSKEQRLLSFDSSDGFIPGEGAGFLLLMSEHASRSLKNSCRSYLFSPGYGYESGCIGCDAVYKGDGLSEAFRRSLQHGAIKGIQTIMSSMNGESYFSKELAVAISRNSGSLADGFEINHIAEYCGDLGASSGAIMISVLNGNEKLQKGPGLIYASSDSGARTTLCMALKN